MFWRTVTLMMVVAAAFTLPGFAQQPPIEYTFEHNSAAEQATADQLRRALRKFDVSKWLYTHRIHIDERAIPHSHPVLTLHTRHNGDENALLATFLHEQFHWLEEGNPQFRAAMDAYAKLYPDAPSRGPEGARDLESTYRHLLVCDLELQVMTHLVGADAARRTLAANRHYTWIYARVLADSNVRAIARTHGFILGGDGTDSRGFIRR
jgi:hypothetical protein